MAGKKGSGAGTFAAEPIEKECPVCKEGFLVAGTKYSRKYPPQKQIFCSGVCASKGRYKSGMMCNDLSGNDAAYIAGFIDGEGSIMLVKRGSGRIGVNLVAAQVKDHEAVLEWIIQRTGIGSLVDIPPRKKEHRAAVRWAVYSDAAETLLKQLLPFLKVKHKQAELAIDFQSRLRNPSLKADRGWQEEYRQQMSALNTGG